MPPRKILSMNFLWPLFEYRLAGRGRDCFSRWEMGEYELGAGSRGRLCTQHLNATLRQYVGNYIAVQFNAITDLATSSGSNIYTGSWTGPPGGAFLGWNQTTALGTLISAIGLDGPSSSSSSATPSSSANAIKGHKSSPLGAILGGTFGGLAVVAALGCALLWLRRRQHRRDLEKPEPQVAQLEPFLSPTNAVSVSEHSFAPVAEQSFSPIAPVCAPPRSRYDEKRSDGHRSPPPPPISSSSAVVGTTMSPSTVSGSGTSDFSSVRAEHVSASNLPTEQLVRLLNQRLQNHQWDEGEVPPEYPEP
ncbi:hypothetical protein B0H19DRAFT_1377142 [Mycena capillaripes]|nr:hypothetical protein B0H19DRAFT_1377142 [Mycena capillaripes]